MDFKILLLAITLIFQNACLLLCQEQDRPPNENKEELESLGFLSQLHPLIIPNEEPTQNDPIVPCELNTLPETNEETLLKTQNDPTSVDYNSTTAIINRQTNIKNKKKKKKTLIKKKLQMKKDLPENSDFEPILAPLITDHHERHESIEMVNFIQNTTASKVVTSKSTTHVPTEKGPTTIKPMTTTTSPRTTMGLLATEPAHCDCELFNTMNLSLVPGKVKTQEGNNIILNCSIETEVGLPGNIQWTFSWGIQRYVAENILTKGDPHGLLAIDNVTTEDSGIYTCTLLSSDGCCSKEAWSYIDVYKTPSYTAALIIIASVFLSQFILCIPLSIYRKKQIMRAVDDPDLNEKTKMLIRDSF